MAGVFERFLLDFYKREQVEFAVRSESIAWQDTFAAGDATDLAYLPQMRTDVSLERTGRKVVVDAKYYRQPLQRHFAKDSVRSGHLYQLFAYLRNLDLKGEPDVRTEGILLYPLVDTPLDLRYNIHGHRVRVATVDLAHDWPHIHAFLLELIDQGP